MTEKTLTDSERLEWLSRKMIWECGSYNGPDYLCNATKSSWVLSSQVSIVTIDSNEMRMNFRDAIDLAIKQEGL